MPGSLVAVVCALAALVGGWAVLTVVRDRRVGRALLAAVAVAEAGVLALLVTGVVALVRGERPEELATTVAYLVVAPLVLPAGAFWTLAERSRPSPLVLLVACLAVVVISYRVFLLFEVAR